MTAVAYVRRSARSRSDPGDISREFQTDTVRRLAGADGPGLTILDGDWGKSASTDATDKRLAFLGLMASIERGEVSALYAYSTDRLARSVEWSARLLNACRRAGTVIVTSEGRFEPDNDMTDQLFYFQAMQNEGYSRQAKKKARATVERRRARGDRMGSPVYGSLPGESLDTVLAAFERTGSYNGTATELNRMGLPARHGGRWAHSSVQRILAREGKAPRLGTRGVKARAPHRLYRLLVCHCGHTLTGSLRAPDGRGARLTIYRCLRAESLPASEHGPKSVAEARLMPWVIAEAERFALPAAVELGEGSRRRERLEAERAHVTRLALVPGVDLATVETQLAAIDKQLEDLEEEALVEDVGPIDWAATPAAELNAILRAYWHHVQLDETMQPIKAEWRLKRMRS